MNSSVKNRYAKLRKEHNSDTSLKVAKYEDKRSNDPRSRDLENLMEKAGCRHKASAPIGDYVVTLTIKPDDLSPEDMGYGRFQSKDDPDGIRFAKPSSRDHNVYVPEYPVRERAENYRSQGYSKGTAWEQAQQDVRSEMARARELSPVWVSMRVVLAGVEICDDSCGGFDGDSAVRDFVWEILDSADRADHALILTEAAQEARRVAAELDAKAYLLRGDL